MDKNIFEYRFKKKDFFDDFSSIKDFEINSDYYFKEGEYIVNKEKNKFSVYGKKDFNREIAINFFKDHKFFEDRIYLFYGNSGMGKSFTLIGTLKYLYDHDTVGTLYIHCKLLHFLIQNDYKKIKEILKDEI